MNHRITRVVRTSDRANVNSTNCELAYPTIMRTSNLMKKLYESNKVIQSDKVSVEIF